MAFFVVITRGARPHRRSFRLPRRGSAVRSGTRRERSAKRLQAHRPSDRLGDAPIVRAGVRAVHADVLDGLEVRVHLVLAVLVVVHALLLVALLNALAKELRGAALSAKALMEAGFSADELKEAGCPAFLLKKESFA